MKAYLANNPQVLDEICDRLAAGESMFDICRGDDMPAARTVYENMARDENIRARIARAREAQQDFEADNCIQIADAATPEDYNVAKLRIWARQWRAAKLAPKKYGDKVLAEHSGPNGGAIEHREVDGSKLALAILGLLHKPADDGIST